MYNLYNGKICNAALFHFFSFVFDCTDGQYARKYNMVSKFGDYYDHVTDILGFIGLLTVAYSRYNINKRWMIFSIVLLIFVFTNFMRYMGYQEVFNKLRNSNYTDSHSLNITEYLITCKDRKMKCVENNLDRYKLFSCTLFHIVLTLLIVSLKYTATLK